MSYSPTNWQTGDTVTAEKLNNMETGIENAANAFIVTLTPTALDYSGVMDKTLAEIHEAYMANKRIFFKVVAQGVVNIAPCSLQTHFSGYEYPAYSAYLIDSTNNIIIYAYVPGATVGTGNTYLTKIYALTPAS